MFSPSQSKLQSPPRQCKNKMEAYKASSGGENCSFSPSLQVLQDWDLCLRLEACNSMVKPVLDKFNRDVKTTLGHLLTVHNDTCGCQFDCASELNKIWNQKKVPFMELHKMSGLSFDDFLNRVLRLLLNNPIQNVEPLNESELWLYLRHGESQTVAPLKGPIDDEELADIQNYILNDIVDQTHQRKANPVSSANSSAASTSADPNSDPSDELAKLKRKEKHMAPIDCTGLSRAYGLTWFCKKCEATHTSKEDCSHYKLFHQPKHIIANSTVIPGGLPPELVVRADGVYTTKFSMIKGFTRLGPLKGIVCDESKMDFDEDRSNVWLLYQDDGTRKCIMTADESNTNWVSNVTPADDPRKANLLAISIKNQLFLVSTEDILPNTKLEYFAKEDPTTEFWTSWTQAWANQRKCSRCSIHGQFENVADYRVHIALWHDLAFQGNPQNRIYYCPDCNAKHIGAKDIVQHCRDVHGTLPFQCRHCNKRFETYNSLIKHKNRIHCEEKPLKKACDKCGKVYLDPKALKQHIRQVHERSEQLHCNQCELILSSKYALNRHVKEVHHRQQEHVCPKCKKHFTQQSNLKQHMLIHLGLKPFLCRHESCKSAFTTKQCLQVHYRKVHHYSDENMPEIRRDMTTSKILRSADSRYCLETSPSAQKSGSNNVREDASPVASSSGNNSVDNSSGYESPERPHPVHQTAPSQSHQHSTSSNYPPSEAHQVCSSPEMFHHLMQSRQHLMAHQHMHVPNLYSNHYASSNSNSSSSRSNSSSSSSQYPFHGK